MRLQTRLALLFGAVVTAAAALMGALSYAAIAERLAAQVDDSLVEASDDLARALADGRPIDLVIDDDGPRGDRRGSSGLLLPTQVLRPDGTVLYGEATDAALPTGAVDLVIARSAQPASRFRDTSVDDRPYRMITRTEGGSNGAVQVGRDVTENAQVLDSLAVLLAVIGIVVAALAALAGWLLARRSAARLVALARAAESVTTTGRLDAQVPATGSDEIGRLGGAFNAMLLRLEQSRDDQQRLVQDAGHELRTPLTSLRTNVSLLRHFDEMPRATRERVIADLDGETKELTSLVNEVVLLATATPTDAAPQLVELAPIAQSVAARAFRRTGRQVEVAADDSVVLGQPAAVERAIWNLVENACKFTEDGSDIELVVDRGTVLVRDRGPGIDPADLPHVFDRFFRATAARSLPGSGLGLAIVRDVAEGHGGQVLAANRSGGGAELGMRLPLATRGSDSSR